MGAGGRPAAPRAQPLLPRASALRARLTAGAASRGCCRVGAAWDALRDMRRGDDPDPDEQQTGVVDPIAHPRHALPKLVHSVVLRGRRAGRPVRLATVPRDADKAGAGRLGLLRECLAMAQLHVCGVVTVGRGRPAVCCRGTRRATGQPGTRRRAPHPPGGSRPSRVPSAPPCSLDGYRPGCAAQACG